MDRIRLLETIESQPILLEQEEGQERRRFKAVFQKADVVNENNRVYPRAVLEKAVEEFKKLIEEGRAVGTLEHPEDGRTRLTDVSHKIVDIYMEEDGTVYGVAECLNTTMGKELQALLEAGVKLGISSRGVGSVKVVERDGKKVEEVQDDFVLEAFDIVYNPSTPGAYIKESKDAEDKYVVVEKDRLARFILGVVQEVKRINREKAEEAIELVAEEFAKNMDVKSTIALNAIAQIVAPLINEEAVKAVNLSEEFKEKERAYQRKIEELELEIYKREEGEKNAVPLGVLAEAKSKEEVDTLIEEYKVKRKRGGTDRVEGRKEGDNPWVKKFSSIFLTGGVRNGS